MAPGPMRQRDERRTAVNVHDQRVFLCGVEIARIKQPSLHIVAVVFPGDALCLVPSGGEFCVAGGYRSGYWGIARDENDFRWMRKGLKPTAHALTLSRGK